MGEQNTENLAMDATVSRDGSTVFCSGYDVDPGFVEAKEMLIYALNADTGKLKWAKKLGGSLYDYPASINAFQDGSLLVGSYTSSQPLSMYAYDFVIFKLDTIGRNQCGSLGMIENSSTVPEIINVINNIFKDFNESNLVINFDTNDVAQNQINAADITDPETNICTNYDPVAPLEGIVTPVGAFYGKNFTYSFPEFCDDPGDKLSYSLVM
jgi:hypothetical protein